MGRTVSRDGPELASRVIACGLATCFAVGFCFRGFYLYEQWAPLALVVFACAIVVVAMRRISLTVPALVGLGSLAFLLVWAAVSTTWAPSVDRAWTEADRLGLYVAILLVGLVTLRTRPSARWALRVFAVAAALIGGYVTIRLLNGSGDSLFLDYRLHDPIGYANAQAGLFLMGFWALLAEVEGARDRLWSAACVAGATLMANLVVLTQARAIVPAVVVVGVLLLLLPGRLRRGWLLVLVVGAVALALPETLDAYGERGAPGGRPSDHALLAAGWATIVTSAAAAGLWLFVTTDFVSRRLRGHRRALATALIVIPVVGAAGALAAGFDPMDEARSQWDSFRSLDDKQVRESRQRFTTAGGFRHDLWRIAINQTRAEPGHGVGAGNYASTYYRERRTLDFVRQPHSIELQMFAELGIPGGLAIVVFAGAVLAAAIRPPLEAVTGDDLALRVGALGVFAVWLAHTSVDWLYNVPALTGVALLAAAILLARRMPSAVKGRARPLVLGAVVVTAALLSSGVATRFVATRYRLDAQDELARDPDAALADARRALRLNDDDPSAYIVAAAAHSARDEYGLARRALRSAAAAEPFNYVPWVLMGDLATRRGDIAQARRDYRRAHQLNPLETEIRPRRDAG